MRAFNTIALLATTVFAHKPFRNADPLWYSDANRTCRLEAKITSPFWLHRWIGTYYNGTIEVTVDVSSDGLCGNQRTHFNETYTGVLSLLDVGPNPDHDYGIIFVNPFIFLLDGWAPDTTQTSLLANLTRPAYLPPAVKLEMESVMNFREQSADFLPWDLQPDLLWPTCEVVNTNISTASGYNFICRYRGGLFDSGQFSLPISTCNHSNIAPFVAMNGMNLDGNTDTLRGTFNEKSADFEWISRFYCCFTTDSLKQRSTYYCEDRFSQTGTFTMKFKGNVDAENSHQMVLGPGNNISWVEDPKKSNVTNFCAAALNETQNVTQNEEDLGVSLHTTTWMAAAIIVGWSLVWVNYL